MTEFENKHTFILNVKFFRYFMPNKKLKKPALEAQNTLPE